MNFQEKQRVVLQVQAHMQAGHSQSKACSKVYVSAATYLRWKKQLGEADGDAALAFSQGKPTGRPVAFKLSEEERAVARWHRLTKSSLEIAIFHFTRDERVSAETKAALVAMEEKALERGKRTPWPLSVRRAFEVTADAKAQFRGRKAAMETEMVTRRGMFWIDEEGLPHDILPGEVWELDDYSTNQPFCYKDPLTGELKAGRQVLAAMNLAGAGWLGFDMIGRARDAYRGEDIVRFIARLMRAHGVPRFLRLERGVWDSKFLHGIEVEGMAKPWGGLDALCYVKHVFKSKGKGGLESSFNPLQNWLAHSGRDVGRHAGEFEESAKAWRQLKNKDAPDPRKLGFWQQDECAAAHEAAAQIMNSRPREQGAMNERISANDATVKYGWHTTPLPPSEAWRLLPYKERRIVRDGHISVNPGGGWPEMSFVINGQNGLALMSGHAVLIAYDPADLAAGAYVCNADQSVRNTRAWGMGQVLCAAAPFAELAPQFDLSGRKHGTLDLRKKASAAAATEFRAIKSGAIGARERAVFDGAGNAALSGDLTPTAPTVDAPAVAPPVRGGLPATAPRVDRVPRSERAAAVAALEAAAWENF